MTAEELISKAALCRACGKEHKFRRVSSIQGTWAGDDGHAYRPVVDTGSVALLRYLATGIYTYPWAVPNP